MVRLVVFACALVAVARPAWADDPAKAKELFEEGRKLVESSDKIADLNAKDRQIATACSKFVESLDLDPQIGTRLNLADCRVRQHKLVEAYAILEDAVAAAKAAHDRETFTKQQLSAVASMVVRVTLRMPRDDINGLAVRIRGKKIPSSEWGKQQILMPGQVVVEVTAPDHKPAKITREGAAGSDMSIIIPTLERMEDHDRDRDRDRERERDRDRDKPPVDQTVHHSIWSYGLMGGGGALVATSIGLGLHAHSRYNTAVDANNQHGISSAQHEADAATAVFIGGAVMAAVGIWMYVHDGPSVTATASSDKVTVALIGTF